MSNQKILLMLECMNEVSNEKLDDFLDIMDEFNSFVQQNIDESFDFF